MNAVLEQKINSLPEMALQEVAQFVDFVCYKFGMNYFEEDSAQSAVQNQIVTNTIKEMRSEKRDLDSFNSGCESLRKQTEKAGLTEQDLYDFIKETRQKKRSTGAIA